MRHKTSKTSTIYKYTDYEQTLPKKTQYQLREGYSHVLSDLQDTTLGIPCEDELCPCTDNGKIDRDCKKKCMIDKKSDIKSCCMTRCSSKKDIIGDEDIDCNVRCSPMTYDNCEDRSCKHCYSLPETTDDDKPTMSDCLRTCPNERHEEIVQCCKDRCSSSLLLQPKGQCIKECENGTSLLGLYVPADQGWCAVL